MERKIISSEVYQKYIYIKENSDTLTEEDLGKLLLDFKDSVKEDNLLETIPIEYKKEADSIKVQLLAANEINEIDSLIQKYLLLDSSTKDYQNEKMMSYVTILIIILSIFVFLTIFATISYFDSHKQQIGASFFAKKVIQVQENERKILSHELHDTVVQDIKGIKLVTSQLLESSKIIDDDSKKLLTDADKTSESAINHLRTICYNLTPPELDFGNLAESIGMLCKIFGQTTGIQCSAVITNPNLLNTYDNNAQLHIFRIIQEALNNTKKHANATEVNVLIRENNTNSLKLIISDDGIGFDVKDIKLKDGSHFGLLSIKDRVSYFNGKLEISSQPYTGTQITAILPLQLQEL